MAYELTSAAATTGNPYAIVGAAIIDTIRATAKTSTTSKGRGLSQNQLSPENFAGYVTDAIGQMYGQTRGTSASIGRSTAAPNNQLNRLVSAVVGSPADSSEESTPTLIENRTGTPRVSDIFMQALTQRSAGTYAQVTAPTITTDNSSQTTKRSIICTTLMELGELHPVVYAAGIPHWNSRSRRMISGYHKWGYWVADLCRKNLLIRKIAAHIARARYHYILFERWNFLGWATVAIGEPLCSLIGSPEKDNAIN